MKIKGKDAFLAQIASLPQAIRDEVRKALEVSAKETTDLQRRFAPVDTGTLRASIGYTFGAAPDGVTLSTAIGTGAGDVARAAKIESGLAVTLFAGGPSTTKDLRGGDSGMEYDYAFAQEFGTRKRKAQPFFFPGYRFGRKRAKARMRRAIRAGARKALGK